MQTKTRGSVLLRERRIKKDLSQDFVAETIGVSKTLVSRFESGERRPQMAQRKAIFALFHIPASAWSEVVSC